MSEKVKQKKTKKYDEWEIKDAVRTLVQAEEIKQNKELMNLVIPELKKQSNAMEQAAKVLYGKNEKEEQQNEN